jgi:hypothetical protein
MSHLASKPATQYEAFQTDTNDFSTPRNNYSEPQSHVQMNNMPQVGEIPNNKHLNYMVHGTIVIFKFFQKMIVSPIRMYTGDNVLVVVTPPPQTFLFSLYKLQMLMDTFEI